MQWRWISRVLLNNETSNKLKTNVKHSICQCCMFTSMLMRIFLYVNFTCQVEGGREDPHLCVRRQFCTLPTTLGCFPTQNWGKDNIPEAQVMVKIHQKFCPMGKPSRKACERVLTLCRVTSTDSSPCLPTAEKGQRVRVHHPFPVASSHVVFLSFWVCCVFV